MVPVAFDAALVGLLEVGAAVLGLVLVVAEEADLLRLGVGVGVVARVRARVGWG